MRGNVSCMMRNLIVKSSYISLYRTFSKKVGFKKYLLQEVGSYLSSGQGPVG